MNAKQSEKDKQAIAMRDGRKDPTNRSGQDEGAEKAERAARGEGQQGLGGQTSADRALLGGPTPPAGTTAAVTLDAEGRLIDTQGRRVALDGEGRPVPVANQPPEKPEFMVIPSNLIMQLPAYASHKGVKAARMVSINLDIMGNQHVAMLEGVAEPFTFDEKWKREHKPEEGMWLVVLPEGGATVMAAKTFMESYHAT